MDVPMTTSDTESIDHVGQAGEERVAGPRANTRLAQHDTTRHDTGRVRQERESGEEGSQEGWVGVVGKRNVDHGT